MHNDIQEKGQRFLMEVYLRTQGEPAATVSMYDIGEALGMDRQNSLRTAEYLICSRFVEIKTFTQTQDGRYPGVLSID